MYPNGNPYTFPPVIANIARIYKYFKMKGI